ncbi:MAG: hypothetical protein AAGG46_06745, partial [Planctomycetota bacterium]
MSVSHKGGNAIVGLLLAHGEKLGIGVIACLVAWLLYGSTQYEGVDKQPGDLSSLATDARTHFQDRFGWTNAVEEPEGARLAEEFTPLAAVRVAAGDYPIAEQGWDPAVVPPIVLREDPPLLPAIGLLARAGTELMGFEGDLALQDDIALRDLKEELAKKKAAEEERRRQEREEGRGGRDDIDVDDKNRRQVRNGGRRGGVSPDEDDRREVISYVTLLAKVPVEEQTAAYWSTFQNALGFEQADDQPVYLGYLVERREVAAGQPSGWEPVFLRNGYDDARLGGVDSRTLVRSTADWLEELEEVADTNYTHDVLTFPLPPLIGRTWGPEVVHPDTPLQVESDMAQQLEDRLERERDLGDEPGGFLDGGIVAEDEEIENEEDEVERLYEAPFLMLRFFDMTVEAGRQYQYRIQLVIQDPNDGAERKHLAKDALARLDADAKQQAALEFRYRKSPWSEPSPAISIPQPGGLL